MNETSSNELQTFVGKNIKKLRLEKKHSLRHLALLAGIEHHQLIKIEKGNVDFRLSTVEKIATALEVQVKDLF